MSSPGLYPPALAAHARAKAAAKPVIQPDNVKEVLRVLTRATTLINTALKESCPNTRRVTLRNANGDCQDAVHTLIKHNPHNPTLPRMFIPHLLGYAHEIRRQSIKPRVGEVNRLTTLIELLTSHFNSNFK